MGLTVEDEAEVILKMWKAEVRRGSRYVPDYSGDKLTKYHITHDGNIKVGVKAMGDFNRSTTTWDYERKVEDQHEGFIKFQQRNYIPRVVSNYWRILNNPSLASFERYIPVYLYYWEICRDSPGYMQPAHFQFPFGGDSTRNKSLHHKSSRNNSSNHRSSRHNSSNLSHHKSASSARHNNSSSSSRNNSARHTSTSSERRGSLRSPQESNQDYATLCSWVVEQVSNDYHQYPHRPDLMTLDDVAEINRLTELISNIRRGNPPSYYLALREDEIHNVRRVLTRRNSRSSSTNSQDSFFSIGSDTEKEAKELEEIFDTNQINLIQAKSTA